MGPVMKALKNIFATYATRAWKVVKIHMDMEFACIRELLARCHVQFLIVAEDEHVPEIERYQRTMKEQMCCAYHNTPFVRLPFVMIEEAAYAAVFWWNAIPVLDGISKTLSPRNLILGATLDFTTHCQLEFGQYVQTHEKSDNTMRPRTTGAISLRPSNDQGGYFFMSLLSGRRIHKNHWTPLTMPAEVIA